jgi:hypothetical protein
MGSKALRRARLARLRYYRDQRLQLQVNSARRVLKHRRWQLGLLLGLVMLLIAGVGAAAALAVARVWG